MAFAIPPIAVKFLEREEGVILHVYLDQGGHPTGGMGHLNPGLPVGTPIPQTQADEWAASDMQTAAKELCNAVGSEMYSKFNTYQLSALLSFVFNEGEVSTWTIWADIKAGNLADVPNQLERFIYVGGKPSNGLRNRRLAEINLWKGLDPLCKLYPVT